MELLGLLGVLGLLELLGLAEPEEETGRRSMRPRESWWRDFVMPVRKVSEVGLRAAKVPCAMRTRRKEKMGMRKRGAIRGEVF